MQLVDILPSEVYQEVCTILDLPIAKCIKHDNEEIKGTFPQLY